MVHSNLPSVTHSVHGQFSHLPFNIPFSLHTWTESVRSGGYQTVADNRLRWCLPAIQVVASGVRGTCD